MHPIPFFKFERSVAMMQRIRRYSWQDIETSSADLLRLTTSNNAEILQERYAEIVQRLFESYTSKRPYDMDGPLDHLNSDYIIFFYVKEHGVDAMISCLRQDQMRKLDFAFMRLYIGFLPAEYGRVPADILTLQFVSICSIWTHYEKDSENGQDYDLKKYLQCHLPASLVNRIFFS